MKRTVIILATLFTQLLSAYSEPANIQPAKVELIATARGSKVYRIDSSGEVTVGGNLIKRIELGKSTAVITYFNKTSQTLQPKYRFRLIDAYGIEVASFDDKWILDSIAPGEAKKEDKSFFIQDLDKLLQFSTIALPADWGTPIYVIIEGIEP